MQCYHHVTNSVSLRPRTLVRYLFTARNTKSMNRAKFRCFHPRVWIILFVIDNI
ncbi:hypothetical protein C8R48DRAFT_741432 [Suillus tomentosus]|nr:hypothetical protein C8R48DRAFT_741432 [Suillus tomentosus]